MKQFPTLHLPGSSAGTGMVGEQDITELLTSRKLCHYTAQIFLYHGARGVQHDIRPCGGLFVDEQKNRFSALFKDCEIPARKRYGDTGLILGKEDLGAVWEDQALLFSAESPVFCISESDAQ